MLLSVLFLAKMEYTQRFIITIMTRYSGLLHLENSIRSRMEIFRCRNNTSSPDKVYTHRTNGKLITIIGEELL
ncbi:MAG: hypothetical protein DRP87_20060 [Spirochaetes bacterium]|nr:MAG: hypothetical protein DRP87_20060 [Spirochaetota bacterium]